MAGYVFENTTQAQAGAFNGLTDHLYFQTATASQITASFAPADGLTVATITLTANGQSLTFPASAIQAAGAVSFLSDNTTVGIHVADNTAATDVITVADTQSLTFGLIDPSGTPATPTTAFHFEIAAGSGDHSPHGSSGSDIIEGAAAGTAGGNGDDNIWGGLGGDTIHLGNGNSHVYGGNNIAGEADGNDTITLGGGSNYVNGNAGDDTIDVGVDAAGPVAGSTGINRVFGGQGIDHINLHGAGSNSVNGNVGNDVIDAHTATGNNSLRGGQGDDVIKAGAGHDTVSGDLGDDTLIVSNAANHVTTLTGGAGDDTFDFSTGTGTGTAINISSTGAVTAADYGSHTYYQEVTDFTVGDDSIAVGTAGTADNYVALKTTFANVADAHNAAVNDIGTSAHEIVATQVGGDTYLFYNGGDEVVKLDHATAANIDFHSFV